MPQKSTYPCRLSVIQGSPSAWKDIPVSDRLFLVNASTMKTHNLLMDTPYILNNCYVLNAWPNSDTIPPSSAVLPPSLADLIKGVNCGDEGGGGSDTLSVEKLDHRSVKLARKVCISLQLPEYVKSEEFLEVLRHKMAGHIFTRGTKYAVNYYGERLVFEVTDIQPHHTPSPVDRRYFKAWYWALPQGNSLRISPQCSPLYNADRTCKDRRLVNETLSAAESVNQVASQISTMNISSRSVQESHVKDCVVQESAECGDGVEPLICKTEEETAQNKLAQSFLPNSSKTTNACASSQSSTLTDQQADHTVKQKQLAAQNQKQFFIVMQDTLFVMHKESNDATAAQKKRVTLDSVVGLEKTVEDIKTLLLLPLLLSKEELMSTYGISRCPIRCGILIYGPEGTGKSMLANAIASELGYHCIHVRPSDVSSREYGESERRLQKIFESARKSAPSIVVIDQLDVLCPSEDASTSTDVRTTCALGMHLDHISSVSCSEMVLVIGMTRNVDSLDRSLRRVGRFEFDLETSVPTKAHRSQIQKKLLEGVPHCVSECDLKKLAEAAHSYVGGDLRNVVNKAESISRRRTQDEDASACISVEDLKEAFSLVKPTAVKELQFDVPQTRWSDVGGMEEVKLKLRQAVEWPLTRRDDFLRLGVQPPHGCLLYGPPGCAKTLMAKALAGESGLNFISVKGPELLGMYVGQSERAVREVFRKARSAAPCIVFFDEIDSLTMARGSSSTSGDVGNRVVTQFLTEMDGLVDLTGVTVVGATNRPDLIDKALLRPGRLDRLVYVPLPDAQSRQGILQVLLDKKPVAPDVDLMDLVHKTQGCSGAELAFLVRRAALAAMTESMENRHIYCRHFEQALSERKPRTDLEKVRFYESFHADFRRATLY